MFVRCSNEEAAFLRKSLSQAAVNVVQELLVVTVFVTSKHCTVLGQERSTFCETRCKMVKMKARVATCLSCAWSKRY